MTRIPLSTYRIQFNRDFTFARAKEIVPYLAALGISDCYASPYLRARPGSMHGCDIIDHHHLNPEIGTLAEYEEFVAALQRHWMGQILDIVPNHMGVMGADNTWWLDVLENGEASAYAEFFDIDWEPLKDELQGKVLVPVLGDQYGIVLERSELKLSLDREKGEFSLSYFQHRFPVNPREYPRILSMAVEKLQEQVGAANEDLLELQSLIAAFGHLPGRNETIPEKREERIRDKEINKKRLANLCGRSHQIAALLEASVSKMNGVLGESGSFDALHELIKNQAFRLAYWRVAADDINYRRFFDVNDLAAVRQENEAVFAQTHDFVLQLVREGKINGLRIDHPDGLYNPGDYFQRLQSADSGGHGEQKLYVVAEKILSKDEQLSCEWPIYGTTGYDFSNLVNGLFVDPDGEQRLTETYDFFIGAHLDFEWLVYECKKLVMDRSLNSELNVLANHLSRIALADRHTCDFTVKSLREALTEIVACFPVYRTYVAGRQVSGSDCQYITDAVESAKSRNTAADSSVYDFIREVLLTRQAEGHLPFYQNSVVHFAMRFQQYTSAVMAKGFEDTGLYRYQRLSSLNDVGGNPMHFGVSAQEFHAEMERRGQMWPHAMLTTSTHDSKRSEDVRARINVLSEIPDLWRNQVASWRDMNRKHKDNDDLPSANDEYLLYQTLIGTWPDCPDSAPIDNEYIRRVTDYMLKAAREAKDRTSWSTQNKVYEEALTMFVQSLLNDPAFTNQFTPFQHTVSHFGMLNSLAQILIKLSAPGVPDIYQGNELWRFDLVDPDNRRAVDYETRLSLLQQVQTSAACSGTDLPKYAQELCGSMSDGRIKMYLTWKALSFRNSNPEIFSNGSYAALEAHGALPRHVIAFTRSLDDARIVVLVPRLTASLLGGRIGLPCGDVWQDTRIQLPTRPGSLRNLFTGEEVTADDNREIVISSILKQFPVALLIDHE